MRKIVLHALNIQQQQQCKSTDHQHKENEEMVGNTSRELFTSAQHPTKTVQQVPDTVSNLTSIRHASAVPVPTLEPRKPHPTGTKAHPHRKSQSGHGTSSSTSLLSRRSSGFGSLQDEGSPTLEWGERGGVSLSPTSGVQSMRQREGPEGYRTEEGGQPRRAVVSRQNVAESQSSPIQAWVGPVVTSPVSTTPIATPPRRYIRTL